MQANPKSSNSSSVKVVVYICHEAGDRKIANKILSRIADSHLAQALLYRHGLPSIEPSTMPVFIMLPVALAVPSSHPIKQAWKHHRDSVILLDDGAQASYVGEICISSFKRVTGIDTVNSEKNSYSFFKKLAEELENIIYQLIPERPQEPHSQIRPPETREIKQIERELTQAQAILHSSLAKLEEESGTDGERLAKSQNLFKQWSGKITKFASFLDDLCFDFLEIIEERQPFPISQERFILTLPLRPRDLSSLKLLAGTLPSTVEDLLSQGQPISLEELGSVFLGHPQINVRNAGEQDFQLTAKLHDQSRLIYQKRVINNLLLFYKVLNKAYAETARCLAWVQENQAEVLKQPASYDHRLLLNAVLERRPQDFTGHLKALEPIVQENHQFCRQAEAAADKIRCKFVNLMEKSLFRVLNDVHQAGRHYAKSLQDSFEHSADLEAMSLWSGIYDDLGTLLEASLKKLEIELIKPAREDSYDPDYHNPFVAAESDPALEDEQIKEIVNWGFKHGEEVLRTADVIVVRNCQTTEEQTRYS